MMTTEIANSIFFIALGGVVLFLTKGMGAEYYTIGPGFFPKMLAILLIITNIGRLIVLYRDKSQPAVKIAKNDRPLYIIAGIFALYAFGNYIIGFTISSLVFLYVLMGVLGNRSRSQKIGTAILATLVVKAIFKWILILPLPAGLLELQ